MSTTTEQKAEPVVTPAIERAQAIADGKKLPVTHNRIEDWKFDNDTAHAQILDGLADPHAVDILVELEDEIASVMTRDVGAKDAIETARVREMLITSLAVAAVRRWQKLQVDAIGDEEVY